MEDRLLLKLVKLKLEGVIYYKNVYYVIIKGNIRSRFKDSDYSSPKVAELLAIGAHFDLTYRGSY